MSVKNRMRTVGSLIFVYFLFATFSGCKKKEDGVTNVEKAKNNGEKIEETGEESVKISEYEYQVSPKSDSVFIVKKLKSSDQVVEEILFPGRSPVVPSLEVVADIFSRLDAKALERGKPNGFNVGYTLNDRGEDATQVACDFHGEHYVGTFFTTDPVIVGSKKPEFYKLCGELFAIRKHIFKLGL